MVIHFHFKIYLFFILFTDSFYSGCLSEIVIKVFENCLFSAQRFIVLLAQGYQTITCNQHLVTSGNF